LEHLIYRY